MICDPLTKAGNIKFSDRLVTCMSTGYFDLRATPESIPKKMAKQKNSKSMKNVSTGSHEDQIEDDAEDGEPSSNVYYWQ